jgi:hypothetical protein
MPAGVTSFGKTYDPKRVIVTWGQALSGFADGTFIEVRPATQRWTKIVGADGEVARSKSNDNTAEIVIHLLQTSASNSYLSKMLALDLASNNGLQAFEIVDANGGGDLFWAQAWIRTRPDVTYAKTVEQRTWTFDTAQIITEALNADYVNLSQ